MECDLEWLPERVNWQLELDQAKVLEWPAALERYQLLATSRMDFVRAVKLDRAVQRHRERVGAASVPGFLPVRLALLGSSTVTHLVAGIRVAGLRRGLLIKVYEGPYGTYRQELAEAGSGLFVFRPEVVLLALDARHVAAIGREAALEAMRCCWEMAKAAFACAVVQQTVMPVFVPLLGNQEHRLVGSPAAMVEEINAAVRGMADEAGVSLLALDEFARDEGIRRWHDAGLWHRAKQEVHPAMSPMYGEQVARVVAAVRGRTAKCLVLDLDHTLWGGGIGDDGLEGIVLGQGSAEGEAFVALQQYVKGLMERGVVLAVCSKNDEANALLPFERHPEMVLRRGDIACFVANWEDKATNLRRIARELNLGLDALVFVDDNPAERGLVRRELPMVAVPEMPKDPAEYVRVVAGAGYFEGLGVTSEDRERTELYAANVQREAGKDAASDIGSYLAGLGMELEWRPFDAEGRSRIVQLINKTNQFNLTTRRSTEAEVEGMVARKDALTMQFRLRDVYGDSGMIGVVACEPVADAPGDMSIEMWLMSCRVLGRQVEDAMLNVVVEQVRERGVRRLIGRYVPTAKNGMVREIYRRMGFEHVEAKANEGTMWRLEVERYAARSTHIACFEAKMAVG